MRHVTAAHRHSALIQARAAGHRASLTVSERRLWEELAAGRVLGVRFRRQAPLLGSRFIADFYASALRLAVEVDGSAHEHRRRADARRDEKLRRLGYHVLRIPAEVVLRDLPRAALRVKEEVERLSALR